ncbi:MAG TPA: hypothetical protein VGV59_13440 [Pyrinomonadaceae bacterium]|nr:hypothetical protein [Pyrinomonadaceae bacterium]
MASPENRGRGKSRIVIDVEKARSERRRRHLGRFPRARRIMSVGGLILLGVLLLAGVGGYLWWQNHKKSPSYSLALLVDAAQRDDVRGVEELIDSDRVAEGFAPQVAQKMAESVDPGRVEVLRRQFEAAMPQLLPRVRETMREEVAKGVKSFSEQTGGKMPFMLLALSVARAADVKEQGETATVNVEAGNRPVEMTMQRTPEGRWKVVGLKDDAVASGIAVRLASAVPGATAAPPTSNEPRGRRK